MRSISESAADRERTPKSSWYALGVLTVVLMLATVDRGIISLLAEPIKKSLKLSDLQLGLMQGTGIALFIAIAAFPLAWLSDKLGRRVVLALSIGIWSAAVIACGLARNFDELMAATAMVGAGEAGVTPITYAVIAELFPLRRRQFANSIFVLATAAGGGVAMALAGQLVVVVEAHRSLLPAFLQGSDAWRVSFGLAALPAPLMILALFTIREGRPVPRARVEREGAVETPLTLHEHLRAHAHTLLPFMFGVGFAVFALTGIVTWFAVIMTRMFGQTAAQVGSMQGLIGVVGLLSAFAITTLLLPQLARKLGDVLQIRVMWVTALLVTVTSFSMAFARSAPQVYAIQAVQVVVLVAANMIYPTALQNLAPAHLRSRVAAIQGVVMVMLGAAAAPLVGVLSDRLSPRADSLLLAASAVAVAGLLVSAALLWACEKTYANTVADIARGETDAPLLPVKAARVGT